MAKKADEAPKPDNNTIANDARQFLRQFSAFVRLAETMSAMGDVDQLTNESLQRKNEYDKSIEQSKTKLAEIGEALKKAQDVLDGKNNAAATIINEARDTAKGIVDDANTKARQIVDASEQQKRELTAEMEKMRADWAQEKFDIRQGITELSKQRDVIAKELQTLKSRLG